MKLWIEQYRPTTLDDYVWVDPGMRTIVQGWLKDGELPHCLLSGTQGTGKTSLAKLMFKELAIPMEDMLCINASRVRQIDVFQSSVMRFVECWAMGPSGIKYILLDEADRMSPTAQSLLRKEMEDYAEVCRFVMTANYPQRIIPAIHSRVQELCFPSLDRDDYTMRVARILDAEHVNFEPETLLAYVDATYPDLRKCIGLVQQYTYNDKLHRMPANSSSGMKDYLLTMMDLFSKGQFLEARKLIIAQIQPEEYDDFYRMLYQNTALFGKTQAHQDDALLLIRQSLINHQVCSDSEINLSGLLIELSRIS